MLVLQTLLVEPVQWPLLVHLQVFMGLPVHEPEVQSLPVEQGTPTGSLAAHLLSLQVSPVLQWLPLVHWTQKPVLVLHCLLVELPEQSLLLLHWQIRQRSPL